MKINQTPPSSRNLLAAAAIGSIAFIIGYLIYLGTIMIQQRLVPRDFVPVVTVSVPRASMAAMPAMVNVQAGDTFDVNVVLDARETLIHGADIIMIFDNAFLKVEKIVGVTDENRHFLLLRGLTEDNRVIVSVMSADQAEGTRTDAAPVATVTFTALAAGSTSIGFEHYPGTTTGSTIIAASTSDNILDKVGGVTVEIE
ncbi:MAG TPA: cohesin domain-containing protein [Patescibacteria group bacterium]|nr:MAG: hypothetical protein A2752_03265 [Candidatus Uhrbacteria bacterium RIFCSPHIGHO2_01_FULL_46_23]HLB60447.1 cohesin domain-containing protein [Patescibacteria group bacterium]